MYRTVLAPPLFSATKAYVNINQVDLAIQFEHLKIL